MSEQVYEEHYYDIIAYYKKHKVKRTYGETLFIASFGLWIPSFLFSLVVFIEWNQPILGAMICLSSYVGMILGKYLEIKYPSFSRIIEEKEYL